SAQETKIKVSTQELRIKNHKNNWIYVTIPHVKMSDYDVRNGAISMTRLHQKAGVNARLVGYVKQNWEVEGPNGMSDEVWLMYAMVNLAVFDLRGPSDKEELQPGET